MSIARELMRFFAPLSSAFADSDQAALVLRRLGLIRQRAELRALPAALTALTSIAEDALATLGGIETSASTPAEKVLRAIEASRAVLDAVAALKTAAAHPEELEYPFDDPQTWERLARALPSWLFSAWLSSAHPLLRAVLKTIGALRANGEGGETIDFAALVEWTADPQDSMRRIDPAGLLRPLRELALALGVLRSELAIAIEPPAPPGFRIALVAPFSRGGAALEVDVEPIGGGLAFTSRTNRALATPLRLSSAWTLETGLDPALPAGCAWTRDGVAPYLRGGAAGAAAISLSLSGAPEEPWALLGSPGATRLELAGLDFTIGAKGLDAKPELEGALTTEGLRLVITAGDGDSFLREALGASEVSADASLALTWSKDQGVRFAGGVGMEVVLPVDRNLGPVHIEQLRIALAAEAASLSALLTVSCGLALGPFAIVVEDIGLAAALSAASASGGGAFGDVDFALAFQPPRGLGISIDAGVVKGGGFISFDRDAGRYAGAGELSVLGTGLTFAGVLLTELPGAPDAWSMFLSLGIHLTGVQLGFGFTLNGVGGLVGVNRGLDPDALGDAVRSGALDAILFPEDPVADALEILSAIDTVFPPARGQYVFGPVVKIGWGTPTLIELDAGVAIQLPDPLTVSLLGAITSVLPVEELPIIELYVAFAGTVDFTAGTLAIDASIGGSRFAGLALTGDMAVRASFLEDPRFLASFGGFHPSFPPPADFPKLARLGIALDAGSDLRLTLGAYFALTSNTVQFGARAELYASALGFTAEGGVSFDTLIQFSPFGFEIALRAWVSISAGSIELMGVVLEGDFSGPSPWHVRGKASFRLLGIKQSLEIAATIGAKTSAPAIAAVDVGALLAAELVKDDVWSVLEPSGAPSVILASASDVLTVHPAGRVRVSQRVAPLDVVIEKYGNATLDGANRFALEVVSAEQVDEVEEYFASEQFFRMSAEEKLSAPDFVAMKAGTIAGSEAIEAPVAAEMTYDFELAYRDPHGRKGARDEKDQAPVSARPSALAAALNARTKRDVRARFQVSEEKYVLADRQTGVSRGAAGDYFEVKRSQRERGEIVRPAFEIGAKR